MEVNRIYNEDCLETMAKMPDGFVDLIETDSPYKGHFGKGGGAFGDRDYFQDVENNVGSSINFDINVYLPELKRVCKKPFNSYFWCSTKMVVDFLKFAEANRFLYDILFWNKSNPVPTKNNKRLPDTEYCISIREPGAKFNNSLPFDLYRKVFWTKVNKNDWGHPTIKPIGLIEPQILISSCEGDLVYDPFMGSGTTAVACVRTGRNYIGSEINKKYCELAEKRIQQELSQLKLAI
jgi:site-specific DNA-methyltransferase (adenine-specific)